ncbi:MAG: nicotinamide-nucleotide amidohydrolase family protein [Kiritimatiellae bacterium]|nr:nicotinamide-nucleotide amidohydrolase family protein [Kiritimatiellia bacterium]
MTGFALETRNLVKRYGRRRVLDGFTLAVPRGAVLGLVGANGAGKTTWMMTVAGLLRPASGTIDMLGCGPFDAAVHAGRFALLPQDSELPLEATPMGLFYRFGRLQGLSSEAARRSACDVLKAVNLVDRAKSSIRSLSHGMRTRVRVAQCFLGNPELVLLDEPLNGLDPLEADRLRRFLRARAGKQTIVISSHNLHDVEQLCTHVAFVENGRVVRMDTLNALTHGRSLESVFLEQAGVGGSAGRLAPPCGSAELLVAKLKERGLTCVTAESCTGGGVGSAITAVPGSSAVFLGGVISYANEVKRDVLDVPQEILDTHGAVSSECAERMAACARNLLKADLAVSLTGIAGPDGGSAEKPVGLVWFGLATKDGVHTEKMIFGGDRASVRAQAVTHALGLLHSAAGGSPTPSSKL